MAEDSMESLGSDINPETGNFCNEEKQDIPDSTIVERGESVEELNLDDLNIGDTLIINTAEDSGPEDASRYVIEITKKPRKSDKPFEVKMNQMWARANTEGENITAKFPGGLHRTQEKGQWGGITQHYIRKGDCLYFETPKDESGAKLGASMRTMPIVSITIVRKS